MAKIFTIGFSGKSPDAFLDVLNAVRVRTVWDIRLWRTSIHVPFYSGEEILAGYKDGRITWPDYERMYRELLAARHPTAGLSPADLDRICLLCTEKSATQCHRRLAAEYIEEQIPDIEIVHL